MGGCKKLGLCQDDELHAQRTNYIGNQLKTQGYYFADAGQSGTLTEICYFYRNGTFYAGLGVALAQAQSGNIMIDVANEFGKTVKDAWGLFLITGQGIEVETWAGAIGCRGTNYRRGEILNDSTFVITRHESRRNGKVRFSEEVNQTFRFRPLAQKPDSTNSFIP
jgi:hypothetical protein